MAWFKADVKGFLRDEKLNDIEIRGAWVSVLALCKLCNHNGLMIDSLECALTDTEICRQARINLNHLEKLHSLNLINYLNEGVTKVTNIPNWLKYQPEYDRQKPYRQAKKEKLAETNKIVTVDVSSSSHDSHREGDVRLEKEKEIRETPLGLNNTLAGGNGSKPSDLKKSPFKVNDNGETPEQKRQRLLEQAKGMK